MSIVFGGRPSTATTSLVEPDKGPSVSFARIGPPGVVTAVGLADLPHGSEEPTNLRYTIRSSDPETTPTFGRKTGSATEVRPAATVMSCVIVFTFASKCA